MKKYFFMLFLIVFYPLGVYSQDTEKNEESHYSNAVIKFRAGQMDEALNYINSAIKESPDDLANYFLKCEIYITKGSRDSAISVLDEISENSAFNDAPLMYKANLYVLMNQSENAIVTLDEILEKNPKNVDALITKARLETKTRQFEKAEKTILRAVEIKPDSGIIHFERGNIWFTALNKKKALESYKKALSLEPENAAFLRVAGITMRELGNYKEAIKYFDRQISQDPFYEKAYLEKSKVYALQKKRDETIAEVKKAVLLEEQMKSYFVSDPVFDFLKNDPEFKSLTAKYHSISIPEDTLIYHITSTINISIMENDLNFIPATYFVNAYINPEYKDIIKDPDVPADRKFFFLGMAMRVYPSDSLRLEKSVEYLRNAIKLDSSNPEYYYQKAISLYLLNRKQECLSGLDIAVYIDDDFISARFLRSFVNYLTPEKSDSVFQDFKIINQYDPANKDALNNYGTFYIWKHGNTDMARTYLQKAVKIDPSMALAYYNLYNLELNVNNLVQAGQYITLAGRHNETFNDLINQKGYQPYYLSTRNLAVQYIILGLYMQDIRQSEKAEYCYKTSIETDPGGALAYYYLGRLYSQQNKIDKAVKNISTAIRLNGNLKESCREDKIFKALQYNSTFKRLISR